VIENLSIQGRLNSRGRGQIQGDQLFLVVSKQNLNPPFGASDALEIIKNGLEMRKLRPPQSRGSQEVKKTNH
jgi:hypothetical protein